MAVFNSQMFFLGNLADLDPTEGSGNYTSENAATLLGSYSQPPLISVDVDDTNNDGVIYDDDYGAVSEDFTYDAGSGQTSQLLDSTQTYMARILLGDGSSIDVQVTVIQMQNGDVFLTDYANNGSIDNLAVQDINLTSVTGADYSGFWANSSVDNTSVVCFSSGTFIATDLGPKPVEDLRPGDLVRTLDHGFQPIRWVGHRTLRGASLERNPHLRPVIIRKGALGNVRTMRVSPQHSFLIGQYFVRAKHLAEVFGGKIARVDHKSDEVTYIHFMCDRHEVVFSDGSASESLYPGPLALQALGFKAQMEIIRCFPALFSAIADRDAITRTYGPSARVYMTRREATQLSQMDLNQPCLGAPPVTLAPEFDPDLGCAIVLAGQHVSPSAAGPVMTKGCPGPFTKKRAAPEDAALDVNL